MRGLLWLTVILAGLWGGWWVVGSRGAKAAAESWLAANATYESVSVTGFPSRFDLTVTGLDLTDPASGLTWRAPFAQVFAMSWKPWHLIAALPGGQVFGLPQGEVTLDGREMMGSVLFVPGGNLSLSEAVAQGEALTLTPGVGAVTGAGKAVASIRADESRANGYRLGASVTGLTLDPDLATGLPATVEEVFFDANLGLTAPIDRHMADTRPKPVLLDLTAARVNWGDLKLSAKGTLQADAAGFAEGQIDIRVENWRLLPPALVAMGLMAEGMAPVVTRGLEVMADQGNDPAVLEIPLIAKGGRMSLGPLPLGPAPVWR